MTKAAGKIIFGCVADQDRKFMDQAVRLVASLRWFGGSVANAPFVVCGVGGMPKPYARLLSRLGAHIHAVERFDVRHPPSNKLRFLEMPGLEDYEAVALLDCDTLIVQDPGLYLPATGFAGKLADGPTVTVAHFEQLFRCFGLPMPMASYSMEITGLPMLPYFNGGVSLLARDSFAALREAWIRWDRILLDRAFEMDFNIRFTDQASLTLALAETGIPVTILPSAMNLPVHFPKERYPAHFHAVDPVIIHYHSMVNPRGGIARLPLEGARQRAKQFNMRLRKERMFQYGGERI